MICLGVALFCFCFSLYFSLLFNLGGFYWDSLSSEILLSVISSLLTSIKLSFHFCYSVFDLQHFFLWFFFIISISVYIAHCHWMLPTLSIGILVIVVLDSLSDDSNIPAILSLVLMLACLFKLCFLPFSIPCNFCCCCWKEYKMYRVKGTVVKMPLVMGSEVFGKEGFYSPMIS